VLEELHDLVVLVGQAWQSMFGSLATVPLPLIRSASYRLEPSGTSISGNTGESELQPLQSGPYPPAPMVVAAEIAWDTLAGRLIEGRAYRGMTRPQLSTAAGYIGSTILWRYETGAVAAASETAVYRFADALGCDRLWLMYGRGEPNWQPQ
jgi:hypothetical protein